MYVPVIADKNDRSKFSSSVDVLRELFRVNMSMGAPLCGWRLNFHTYPSSRLLVFQLSSYLIVVFLISYLKLWSGLLKY